MKGVSEVRVRTCVLEQKEISTKRSKMYQVFGKFLWALFYIFAHLLLLRCAWQIWIISTYLSLTEIRRKYI